MSAKSNLINQRMNLIKIKKKKITKKAKADISVNPEPMKMLNTLMNRQKEALELDVEGIWNTIHKRSEETREIVIQMDAAAMRIYSAIRDERGRGNMRQKYTV